MFKGFKILMNGSEKYFGCWSFRIKTILIALGLFTFGGCSWMVSTDPDVRYIAFGDSTTDGPAEQNYWQILAERLEEPPETFVNQGTGGESADEGFDRLERLIEKNVYPNAHTLLYWQGGAGVLDLIRDLDPTVIYSPDDPEYPFHFQLEQRLNEIQNQIEQAVTIGQNAGLTVYVATYYYFKEGLPCRPLPDGVLELRQAEVANAYVVRLNHRIRLAAVRRNAALIDVGAIADQIYPDPENYFDCNHLDIQGNQIVADLFYNAIINQSP